MSEKLDDIFSFEYKCEKSEKKERCVFVKYKDCFVIIQNWVFASQGEIFFGWMWDPNNTFFFLSL